MSSLYLLARCEHIANLSAQMLVAARAGDWQEVDHLKASAGNVINEVRALSAAISLSADERKAKLSSMQRILYNDGQIQALAQPWLRRVATWLPNAAPVRSAFEGLVR